MTAQINRTQTNASAMDSSAQIPAPQWITILGSTGSIGVSTLDVLSLHPEQYAIFALTADRSVEKLAEQCLQYKPRYAVMADSSAAQQLQARLTEADSPTEVLAGKQSLIDVAMESSVDVVMAAIVGAAGLLPTLGAVKSGKKVLLANKEALVMAGNLFMDAVRSSGATLLPVDSEHNAIFQCLPVGYQPGQPQAPGIKKLVLTASGGPFRTWSTEQIARATPEQACLHPNWSMGKKISVDSATLMNKGLEFIEARCLFDVDANNIQIVVHPQSVVHSMVEYTDGSLLAQLGQPDMRTPIAHALAWPERIASGVNSLDLMTMGDLQFEAPDTTRFPALSLAVAAASSTADAAVLNAANEIAVDAFLQKRIGFNGISDVLSEVMELGDRREPDSIDAVLDLDSKARSLARQLIQSRSGT